MPDLNPSATASLFWALVEDNEWEGERWTVFFEAAPEFHGKLLELQELLDSDEDIPYELYEVDEIPSEFDDGSSDGECEYGEDDCGDCEGCVGSEGYYDPESEGVLNPEVLEAALAYYRAAAVDEPDEDDPLYKLGLFVAS